MPHLNHRLKNVCSTVLLIGSGLLGTWPTFATDLVVYDDNAAIQFSQLERVYQDTAAAHAGNFGLRVEPTYWHNQFMRLAAGRTDFRPFSALELNIRAESGAVDPAIVLVDRTWGSTVRVADYVEGGIIDEQWRRAVIPMQDLVSDEFALDSVYLIAFRPSSTPRAFFVDDLVLLDASRPNVLGWSMPSNRVISVRVDQLDVPSVGDASGFTVSSATDPNYLAPLSAIGIGVDRSAVAVTDTGTGAVVESRLHLLLPHALESDHDYLVGLGALLAPSGQPMQQPGLTITYDPNAVSTSIKVNQVGYLPSATKIGFIGNWLGDLGPMPVDAFAFQVVDAASGATAWSGELLPRIADDPQSGEDVYTADFSGLSTPGTYELRVPGIGRSHPFEIANDVYADVYHTTMRVLYHKRNTSLTAPYADPGFERAGIDDLLDAVFHPVLADYLLTRGEQPFAYKPITKGWYDAGDYGQYIHNAASVWPTIALALDLAPANLFEDGELGIPESGNGVPDILDELRWGMEWALSMQDEDGGVYWRVASGHWDMGLPADVSEPRFIYEKTTRATAQFAAMAAIYSRLIAAYDSAEANAVLEAALRAWNFVNTHQVWPPEGELYQNPADYPGGGTYAVRSAKPDRLWAAAELYRSTGEAAFQDAYRGLLAEVSIDISAAPMSTWAYWAIAKSEHADRDILLVERARRSLMAAADIKLERSAQSPYRSPKHPAIDFTGWYNFSVSPIASLALLQAQHLSGEAVYLDAATQIIDIILGANPQSRAYLTGIGDDPVRDPMDRISLNDANPEPLRGLTVAGPTWHLPAFREPYASVNAAYWPPEQPTTDGDYRSAYPALRRWVDDHDLIPMNESTVREWAPVAVAFGLLRDGEKAPTIAAQPYQWVPGGGGSTGVYRLSDIPVADVPLLTPEQITAFGAEAVNASADHLAALTATQVAAIDAPNVRYWVGKLSLEQQLALSAVQIAAFNEWSLFTALPPQQVPLVPSAKIQSIGVEVRNTTDAWKAAITPEQRAAMTQTQQQIMQIAGH